MAPLTLTVFRPAVVLRRCWLGLLPWLLAGLAAAAPLSTKREYQVKAGFLFNLAQFVDWPDAAFPRPDTPVIIGVLGDDPFGGALEEVVRGEEAHGRALRIRHYQRVEEVDECHVLFISRSEAARLEQVLAALRGRSVLTVGDFENFARRGGMIRFVTDKNKIRMRISRDVALAAGLKISSKILRAAEIIRAGKD